jgi:hypothetical protein
VKLYKVCIVKKIPIKAARASRARPESELSFQEAVN